MNRVINSTTFKGFGGVSRPVTVLLADLDKLRWDWEITVKDDVFKVSLYFGRKDTDVGSIHGGADSLDAAFDKIARWVAERFYPPLAILAHAAASLLEPVRPTDKLYDQPVRAYDYERFLERARRL